MLHKLREVPVLHIRQGRALKITNSKEEEGEGEGECEWVSDLMFVGIDLGVFPRVSIG